MLVSIHRLFKILRGSCVESFSAILDYLLLANFDISKLLLPVKEYPNCKTFSNLGRVMVSFRSDCREAFVISGC